VDEKIHRSQITLKAELRQGQGYRYHCADMTGEEQKVIVKVFEGLNRTKASNEQFPCLVCVYPPQLFAVTKIISQDLWYALPHDMAV
jgi:hypothetical protein